MLRNLLLISLLTTTLAAPALAETQTKYSVFINPHATSYKGQKFRRQVRLDVFVELAEQVNANAIAKEDQICQFGGQDGDEPFNCVAACTSTVTFSMGQFSMNVQDVISRVQTKSAKEPIIATHSTTVPGACNGRVPEIVVAANHAASSQNNAIVSAAFASHSEQEVSFSLESFGYEFKSMGANHYQVTKTHLPEKLNGYVYYYQSPDWGVSGPIVNGQVQMGHGI